jgi:hypothetical protein
MLCPDPLDTPFHWAQLSRPHFHEFPTQPVLEVPPEAEGEIENITRKSARNAEKRRGY